MYSIWRVAMCHANVLPGGAGCRGRPNRKTLPPNDELVSAYARGGALAQTARITRRIDSNGEGFADAVCSIANTLDGERTILSKKNSVV
jgi:hypothetical protein